MKKIHSFLELSADRYPQHVALIHDNRSITYAKLNEQTELLANWLTINGLKAGDRTALIAENSIDWVVCYYAVLKVGATLAPINTDAKPNSFRSLMERLSPHLIFVSKRMSGLIKASGISTYSIISSCDFENTALEASGINRFNVWLSNEPPADPPTCVGSADLANIIYTSGSTAEPKGVMLSHSNIWHNVQAICEYQRLTPTDRHLLVLPFYYVMGLSVLNTHMAVGATVVICNQFAYAAKLIDQMIYQEISGFSGVPSSFAFLLHRSPLAQRAAELKALRFVAQAGGHMSSSVKSQLRECLPQHVDIYIMYGATEAAARLSYLSPEHFQRKMGSIGKAIPGVSLRVLDESGAECEPGEVGELVAQGPNIMQGYFRDPNASRKVLSDLGYHTGDLAYEDEEGFLFLVGRKDSLIKVGGHRVSPQEVENLILETRMAMEAAVIGVDDPMLGHRMVALIGGLQDGIDTEYFEQLCRRQLPKTKTPNEFLFINQIPKRSNGKPDRQALLSLYDQFKEKLS